ncbi:hypothetical protein [Demequina lutea]|uniref:Uncharacterized protein n=1 Tax=Demequina lutea TaxID=431489 RepID=A0A7Y9ZDF9_9MICO|nr:hypothetical protein [Demequina lutea]NYI42558.1 hypothetical protein [Demequina lutea]
MASDEQKSPWFPIQPEGQPLDDAPAAVDATAEPAPPAAPATTPPAAMPSFDDVVAPERAASAGAPESARPFDLTPSRPSMTRPATAPIPNVTRQDPSPQGLSQQPPALSPYLSAGRPSIPQGPYEPPTSGAFQATPPERTPVPDAYQPPAAPAPAAAADAYQPSAAPAPAAFANPYAQPSAAPAPTYSADEAWRPDRRAGFPATGPIATPPTSTGPIEQPSPAVLDMPKAEAQPPIPYAPWTGAIPQVELPVPATTPTPTPTATPTPTPTPTPTVEAEPEPTPTPTFAQEPLPAQELDAPMLVGGLVPTPVEAEEADIVAPVLPPDATEIQPRGADPLLSFGAPATAETRTPAEPQGSTQEYIPDAADPVRRLGESALSTASLEAAGAPTPRQGVPLSGGDRGAVPSFGEEEPFVPRFEPFGGAAPAPLPTVSFTTPSPATRPQSPLADIAIPESDGPAYAPKEEFLDTEFPYKVGKDKDAHTTTAAPATAPVRPWAAVDPTEFEFVDGEPLSVEVGTFGSEALDPVDGLDDGAPGNPLTPTAPSWEGIMGGETVTPQAPAPHDVPVTVQPGSFPPVADVAAEPAGSEAAVADDDLAPDPTGPSTETEAASTEPLAPAFASPAATPPATPPATPATPPATPAATPAATPETPAAPVTPVTPVTPVASFFAATAARSAHRADNAETAALATPSVDPVPVEASAPASVPVEASAPASIPNEPLRLEPVRTTATAYTPSTGAWSRPVFAPADAVTQVDGMARVADTTELKATDTVTPAGSSTEATATGHNPEEAVKTRKAHTRRRLVVWIVLGALVAGAAVFLAYRLYFMPDPVILPTPTATAEAPAPTAKPIAITNASAFATAMPTVVGTDVLIDYTVTDTVGDSTMPARTAEQVTLDYGPGSSSTVFTVEAYQHYNQTDAQTAYDSYAKGATDVKDVVVNGTTVGKRAFSTTGSKGTVVWRNGTAVFDLTGPASDVLGFFEHFGV